MPAHPIIFSIVIPTFNRADFLPEVITSILSQRSTNLVVDLIVVDDGSQDNTESVVHSYPSESLRYIKISNRERGAARNAGLRLARGHYVNYFDSDDIFNPCLNKIQSLLHEHNYPPVVFGEIEHIDENGQQINIPPKPYDDFKRNVLHNNFMACGAVFLKKEIALQYPFSEDRKLSGTEDWELWLRIYASYDFIELPVVIFRQRHHPLRSLSVADAHKIAERERAFIMHIRHEWKVLRLRFNRRELNALIADRWSLTALAQAESRNIYSAFRSWVKSLWTSWSVAKRKRFWAVAKKIFLPGI